MTDRYGAHPDDYDPEISGVNLNKDQQSAPSAGGYGSPNYYPSAPRGGSYGSAPADVERTSPLAITGFVLSIVSLFINLVGLVNIAALIVSILGLTREVNGRGMKGRGFALAGIIISAVGLVLGIILLLVFIGLVAAGANSSDCITNAGSFSCNYSSS